MNQHGVSDFPLQNTILLANSKVGHVHAAGTSDQGGDVLWNGKIHSFLVWQFSQRVTFIIAAGGTNTKQTNKGRPEGWNCLSLGDNFPASS